MLSTSRRLITGIIPRCESRSGTAPYPTFVDSGWVTSTGGGTRHRHRTDNTQTPCSSPAPTASTHTMSGKPPRAGPGPSAAAHKAHPERSYTGPKPDSLPRPRTPAEAEAFYASLAKSGTGPPLPRFSRMIGVAGWVAGGCECRRGDAGRPEGRELLDADNVDETPKNVANPPSRCRVHGPLLRLWQHERTRLFARESAGAGAGKSWWWCTTYVPSWTRVDPTRAGRSLPLPSPSCSMLTPQIRREYHKFTDSLFNLSASERSMIEAAGKEAAVPATPAAAAAPATAK